MATRDERLLELMDEMGMDYKQILTWLFGGTSGTLADLTTTNKSSFVAAVNEVKASASGAPPDATEAQKGVVLLASLLDMQNGVSTSKVATVHGVRQEIDALKASILGGATSAYDTLQELKALVDSAEETSFIDALTTQVGLKANTADVYTKVQIDDMYGDPDLNLLAAYQAAKA